MIRNRSQQYTQSNPLHYSPFAATSGKEDSDGKKDGSDYDPANTKYHPIDDAFWTRGER